MSSQRTHARGFTLLEMTVVLLLVALMSVIVIQALRFGMRAYTQVVKVNDANWDVFVAQRFLRGTLETAYPFDPRRSANKAYGLEGTATRLSFSAALPKSTVPGVLNRYEIFVDDSGDNRLRKLLIGWRPDRDGRPRPAGTPDRQEVLMENIEGVEWSYASVSCDSGQIRWQETWQGHSELPALVRMKIVFPKDDPRQWPVLVIAPRVTDDAMSWIDRPADTNSACGSSG